MGESAQVDVLCMACDDKLCDFRPRRLVRRPLGPHDVLLHLSFCGVCHSDLHIASEHMRGIGMKTEYPIVPGHELAGVCVQVGHAVTKIKVGDHVGVGCLVDSCFECNACQRGEENNCKKQVFTYNGRDWSGRAATPGRKTTLGGYSDKYVVHERFAVLIPKSYPLEAAGPIMCAGSTMYDPLRRYGATKGTRVAIVGLGGLGILGIKLAKALGCEVTAISRSVAKKTIATEAGATSFVVSVDPKSMREAKQAFDLILNTIPSSFDYRSYQRLVKPGGRQVILGLCAPFVGAMVSEGLFGRQKSPIVSSYISGIKGTQEVMNLCAENNILPLVELRPIKDLNAIYQALDQSNSDGVRYVLDIGGTLNEKAFEECLATRPQLKLSNTRVSVGPVAGNIFSMLMSILVHRFPTGRKGAKNVV